MYEDFLARVAIGGVSVALFSMVVALLAAVAGLDWLVRPAILLAAVIFIPLAAAVAAFFLVAAVSGRL